MQLALVGASADLAAAVPSEIGSLQPLLQGPATPATIGPFYRLLPQLRQGNTMLPGLPGPALCLYLQPASWLPLKCDILKIALSFLLPHLHPVLSHP